MLKQLIKTPTHLFLVLFLLETFGVDVIALISSCSCSSLSFSFLSQLSISFYLLLQFRFNILKKVFWVVFFSVLSTDSEAELQSAVSARLTDMRDCGERAIQEHKFWADLAATLIGVGVNTGLEKAALAQGLRTLRNRTLATFLGLNALWLAMLSYFYLGADSPLARLNIYGVMSGALYGFTLAIQLVGLTAGRLEQVLGKVARRICRGGGDNHVPVWVSRRESREE